MGVSKPAKSVLFVCAYGGLKLWFQRALPRVKHLLRLLVAKVRPVQAMVCRKLRVAFSVLAKSDWSLQVFLPVSHRACQGIGREQIYELLCLVVAEILAERQKSLTLLLVCLAILVIWRIASVHLCSQCQPLLSFSS